jgi:hypothetical protein
VTSQLRRDAQSGKILAVNPTLHAKLAHGHRAMGFTLNFWAGWRWVVMQVCPQARRSLRIEAMPLYFCQGVSFWGIGLCVPDARCGLQSRVLVPELGAGR